jgi:hypothetical protein
MLSLFPAAQVWLFESTWDLCSLQQGSDSRWLHPRIYGWPEPESRFPSAALPILDWNGGRASDVADQILGGFGRYLDRLSERSAQFTAYVGVEHLRIRAGVKQIEWLGREGIREGIFFRAGQQRGESDKFDTIVVAVGFGKEVSTADGTPAYWENDDYGEPILDGSRRPCLLSGYGDGALVDLCRLTIERFRQDRIVYDLFGVKLEEVEVALRREIHSRVGGNLHDVFLDVEKKLLDGALKHLSTRIRKDTKVVLHLAGGEEKNKELRDAFNSSSSVLNRLLLYMLFRCGAFVPNFKSLTKVRKQLSSSSVILRHGPEPLDHLYDLFVDLENVKKRLDELHKNPRQVASRQWIPGSFAI